MTPRSGASTQIATGLAALVFVVAGCTSAPPAPSATASTASPTARPTVSPTERLQPTSTPRSQTPAPSPTDTAIGELSVLITWYLDGDRKAAHLISRDGRQQQRILQDVVGDIRAATWSPSGDQIVFVVRDDEHPGGAIWTSAADGSGAALFYDGRDAGCVDVFHPVWSPDGSAMSMVCYGERDASLAVLDVGSMQLKRLVTYPWPEFLDGPARWSHDGRRLAFTVLHWDPTDTFLTGSRLATIDADGASDPVYISEFESFYSAPDWSPDDQRLVFNSYDLGNMRGEISDLYTAKVDGSDIRELAVAADAGVERLANPTWDPNGTRIWVAVVDANETSFHVGWVDPDSGRLTTLPTAGAGAEPQPPAE